MIVDHRTYTLHPGKMKEYLDTYEREGLPIQSRYLGQPLAWYVSMDIGALNQVVHMWGYESLDDRAKRRAQLAADPAWQEFLKKAMPLLQTMENKILSAAPFMAKAEQ